MLTVSSQRWLWKPLIRLAWFGFDSRDRGNSQVRSGLVMKPDKAVRTVQQTAVLCNVSGELMYYATTRT